MRRLSQSSIIVLVLNLLGWGAFGVLVRQLHADSDKVIMAYQELQATVRGKEDLATISRTLTETVEPRTTLAAAFLSGDSLIAFIEKIEGLARLTGVELALAEPKVVTGKTPGLGLTFQATGSFVGLYRLLALVENLPYRLDWQSLTFSLKSGAIWTGDFDLLITSYNPNNATK